MEKKATVSDRHLTVREMIEYLSDLPDWYQDCPLVGFISAEWKNDRQSVYHQAHCPAGSILPFIEKQQPRHDGPMFIGPRYRGEDFFAKWGGR